jgi:hypothetical protein
VRRRRAFQDAKWAGRDGLWAGLYVGLILFGYAYPVLLYVVVAVPVVLVVVLLVRHWRNKRRWARQGPPEFWADKIR